MNRKEIRNQAKKLRGDLGKEYRQNASYEICNKILELVPRDKSIFVYISMEDEVDTALLINEYDNICVPRCINRETMEAVKEFSQLEQTAFGTMEPTNGIVTDAIHVAIVPGLAFNKDMDRIGYGAGYYDRFLSKHPGIYKIAVCFDCQLRDDFQSKEHDVKMDCIVTEKQVIYGESKS